MTEELRNAISGVCPEPQPDVTCNRVRVGKWITASCIVKIHDSRRIPSEGFERVRRPIF